MKKILLLCLAASLITLTCSLAVFAGQQNMDARREQLKVSGQVKNERSVPRVNISRGEFIAQLHQALNITICYFAAPDVHKIFSDVRSDYKFGDQLYDMYSTGIVDDKRTFRPNAVLTREEAVHYIVRAYNYKNNERIGEQNIDLVPAKFKNVVYLNDITQARKLGLVGKDRLSTFKKAITRTEAIALVNKLQKLINENEKPLNPPVNKLADLGVTTSAKINAQGLEMSVNITNNTAKSISSYYQPGRVCDYVLLDQNNNEIYRWSTGKMFLMVMMSLELKPGESKQFAEQLSYDDYKDIIEKAKYFKVEMNLDIEGMTVETPNVVEIVK